MSARHTREQYREEGSTSRDRTHQHTVALALTSLSTMALSDTKWHGAPSDVAAAGAASAILDPPRRARLEERLVLLERGKHVGVLLLGEGELLLLAREVHCAGGGTHAAISEQRRHQHRRRARLRPSPQHAAALETKGAWAACCPLKRVERRRPAVRGAASRLARVRESISFQNFL